MATDAKKVRLFQVISRAELSERIPRVPGAFHFALPFVGDADVDWVDYLDGEDGTLIQPRAIPISMHPDTVWFEGSEVTNPKAGMVYPTNIVTVLAGIAAAEDINTYEPITEQFGDPILDGEGQPVLDGEGQPTYEPILDAEGQPLLDGEGQPITYIEGEDLTEELFAAIEDGRAEARRCIGALIDGFDHTKDLNITVTLAAGIPQIYLQGSLEAPSETVDPDIVTCAPWLGLKLYNGQVFWNKVQ